MPPKQVAVDTACAHVGFTGAAMKVQIQSLRCHHTKTREFADGVSIARLSRKLFCSKCGSKAMLAQQVQPENAKRVT